MFHPASQCIDVTNILPLTMIFHTARVEKEYDDGDDVEGKVHGR
jgi:hypothetical protein